MGKGTSISIETVRRNLLKLGLDLGAGADAPDDAHAIAGLRIADAFEQPGRRRLQDWREGGQGLGGDAAPVAAFDGALQIADGVRLLRRERGGVGGKAKGFQPAFDAGENVFQIHNGRITVHFRESIR